MAGGSWGEECDFVGQIRFLLYMAIGPWQQKCRNVFGSTLPRGLTKSGHGWTRPGRAVHGRNVMVRQLRVAQYRVRTYTFLLGEGSTGLLKN